MSYIGTSSSSNLAIIEEYPAAKAFKTKKPSRTGSRNLPIVLHDTCATGMQRLNISEYRKSKHGSQHPASEHSADSATGSLVARLRLDTPVYSEIPADDQHPASEHSGDSATGSLVARLRLDTPVYSEIPADDQHPASEHSGDSATGLLGVCPA